MNSKEFVDWLRGYLDGVEEIQGRHKKAIIEKMADIDDSSPKCPDPYRYTYPFQTTGTGDVCPAGGQHNYEFPWFSTSPPPCKKCGKPSSNNYRITCY